LKDPEFHAVASFPIGEDEDIPALSDPPCHNAGPTAASCKTQAPRSATRLKCHACSIVEEHPPEIVSGNVHL
jgi:hypothetical protein